MSLIKDGKLVYPLKQYRIKIGNDIVYDRDTRGKSWFILDYISGMKFVPRTYTGLITANGKEFHTNSRHGGS